MESLEDILRNLTPENGSGGTDSQSLYDSNLEDNSTKPTCEICGNFGWVRRDVPLGHPDFGKVFRCNCQLKQYDPMKLARLQRYSNLGSLTNITFSNTVSQGRSKNTTTQALFMSAHRKALDFADNQDGWLILTGASGSGKTHLAAAIANHVLENGNPSFFVFVPDLLDHLRATFGPTVDVSYDQFFEQVRNAPLLVLDDLGGHSTTPWAQEKLYQILNHRYNAKIPTVVTLNTDITALESHWQTRLSDPDLVTTCDLGMDITNSKLSPWGSVDHALLHRMTFATFKVKGNRASSAQSQTLEVAFKMAVNFSQYPEGWLVFIGPTGCGKTHLSVAIANERLNMGNDIRYFLVADLLDRLRDAFNPESTVSYYKLFEEVRNTDLLVLRDFDFDLKHVTPWAREKLHQLLVHRYDARLPTVITTSQLNEGSRSDPIMSRLQDATLVSIVPIDAPDYRYSGRSK